MSTKRMLLDESRHILQHDLNSCLKQDLQKVQSIAQTSVKRDLLPIIGSFETTEDRQQKMDIELIKLIQCRGWVRYNRIWIQAQGLSLYVIYTECHGCILLTCKHQI
jgi:translation initiation factor 1 (eIF-1/SUI1)